MPTLLYDVGMAHNYDTRPAGGWGRSVAKPPAECGGTPVMITVRHVRWGQSPLCVF